MEDPLDRTGAFPWSAALLALTALALVAAPNRLPAQQAPPVAIDNDDIGDRVARGELPKNKPPRPAGVERNVVVTSWERDTDKTYLHDLISSDQPDPTLNAYGPLYGSPEYSTDDMPVFDPKTHKTSVFNMPVADKDAPESRGPPLHASATTKLMLPSA
jgi:hypothetical protein